MVHDILRVAFFAGFLAVWLGFACMILPVQLRFFFRDGGWKSLFLPSGARIARQVQVLNAALHAIGQSRIGRAGQVLTALGISLLILTGIGWIVLRIVERQG